MFNLPEIKGKLISISSVEKRQKYLCIRFLPSKDRNGRGDVLSPLAAPLYLIENQETLRRDYVTESFSPPPLSSNFIVISGYPTPLPLFQPLPLHTLHMLPLLVHTPPPYQDSQTLQSPPIPQVMSSPAPPPNQNF